MSNVSNAHDLVDYVSGSSKPFAGQRLSKVTYKTDKETGVKKDSKCVSLPVITATMVQEALIANDALALHISSYLESVQDSIVRVAVDAGSAVVTDAMISMDSICEYLDSSSSTGERLTKESVSAWFDSCIEEELALRLAEKLGVSEVPTDAESEKVMQVIAQFRDKVSSLAGGKTSFPVEIARAVRKVIDLAPAEDAIGKKFAVRLDKMIAAPKVEIDLLTLL